MDGSIYAGDTSYQSSCNDQPAQRKHEVQRHWCRQPGQMPRVLNVFQMAPQLGNGGSGLPSTHTHDQRSFGDGCHPHSGHRIRLNASSTSSRSGFGVVVRVRDRSRFSAWYS